MRESPRHRWASAVILAAVLAVGVSPFLFMLPVRPHSWDATVWVVRGALSNPDWADWVFGTSQFNVGYRPVTAISYTVDYIVGGYAAFPYRLTDLVLHMACAVLVYALYRRIAPNLPSWGGLVAAGVVVAHPVTEQIVPHLARRSYPLSSMLSLAALVLLSKPAFDSSPGRGRAGWVRSILAGSLLALALLANETSVLAMVLLPWLALGGTEAGPERRRRVLAFCLVPGVFVLGAIVLRSVVLGGLVGGYTVEADRASRIGPIILAALRTLGAGSDLPAHIGAVVTGTFALISVYYVWRAARAVAGTSERVGEWLLATLAVWVAGYFALFAGLGVWFPRQGYSVLVPFALLVGVVLADTFRVYGEGRKALVVHLIPQAVLLGVFALQSPIVRGVDPVRAAAWTKTDRVLRDMQSAVVLLPEPAEVLFAVPEYTRKQAAGALKARAVSHRPNLPARRIETWMRAVNAGRRLTIEGLLTYARHPQSRATPPAVTATDPPRIELPAGLAYATRAGADRVERTPSVVRISAVPTGRVAGARAYLFFHDGTRGHIVPLGPERRGP